MAAGMMKIDFNNVRRQAIAAYSRVVRKLRAHTEGGQMSIDVCEIETDMDDLRSALVGIGATFEPGNAEFECVLTDERLPALNDDD
jgi:hypothetical protein